MSLPQMHRQRGSLLEQERLAESVLRFWRSPLGPPSHFAKTRPARCCIGPNTAARCTQVVRCEQYQNKDLGLSLLRCYHDLSFLMNDGAMQLLRTDVLEGSGGAEAATTKTRVGTEASSGLTGCSMPTWDL
ncbi:hypothetical protein M3J09_002776 [Ascochyta lentis]